MTAELWTFLGIVVSSAAVWEFVKFLIDRRDKKKKQKADKSDKIDKNVTDLAKALANLQKSVDQNNADMKLQSEALMAMAQDTILTKAREYKDRGFVYSDELANLHRLADAYRDLHGNGEVKIQMDIIDTLEVKIR